MIAEDWRRWLDRCSLGALPLAAVGLVRWGPGAMVVALVVGAMATVLLRMVATPPLQAPPWTPRELPGHLAVTAKAGVLVVGASVVLVTWPVLGLPLIVLLVVLSPPVTTTLAARRSPPARTPRRPPPTPPPAWTPVGPLPARVGHSDVQLCRAWRSSYFDVTGARWPAGTYDAVVRRQLLLDELCRRHPGPMAAWLDTEPRAGEGPERFLRTAPRLQRPERLDGPDAASGEAAA